MVQRAALIAVVVVATACRVTSGGDASGNPYVPLSTLEAEPASRLAMPDAEVIRNVGGERFDNITGPEPSFTGAYYGVRQPSDRVFAFYDRELLRLGWLRDLDPIPASGESATRGWCRTDMRFRLAIVDPNGGAERIGLKDIARFDTVFRGTLVASRGPCPHPVRTMPPPRSGV